MLLRYLLLRCFAILYKFAHASCNTEQNIYKRIKAQIEAQKIDFGLSGLGGDLGPLAMVNRMTIMPHKSMAMDSPCRACICLATVRVIYQGEETCARLITENVEVLENRMIVTIRYVFIYMQYCVTFAHITQLLRPLQTNLSICCLPHHAPCLLILRKKA